MQHLPHDLCFVFSAHAEVVPVFPGPCQVWWGILRARGGSSANLLRNSRSGPYSPRTRR